MVSDALNFILPMKPASRSMAGGTNARVGGLVEVDRAHFNERNELC